MSAETDGRIVCGLCVGRERQLAAWVFAGPSLALDGRVTPMMGICQAHRDALEAFMFTLGQDSRTWTVLPAEGVTLRPLRDEERLLITMRRETEANG